jgi:hypothetical protein
LQDITSIKWLPPRPYLTYIRRHGGYLWPILWIGPYVKYATFPLGRQALSKVRTVP